MWNFWKIRFKVRVLENYFEDLKFEELNLKYRRFGKFNLRSKVSYTKFKNQILRDYFGNGTCIYIYIYIFLNKIINK